MTRALEERAGQCTMFGFAHTRVTRGSARSSARAGVRLTRASGERRIHPFRHLASGRRPVHAGAGCPMIAPVRGSMSTAAKIPLAATAITTNSALNPQVAWTPAMRGRADAITEKVTI